MFLDGDAFPIADPMPLIEDGLSRAPLLAVRRAENVNDLQPHPCFCVTTVGAWRSLPGDWSAGYSWVDPKGRSVSDVGANLLRQLQLTNTPWVEVLRSNRRNLDPLFFGIYGDTVYHHGAGFRSSDFSRVHLDAGPAPLRCTGYSAAERGDAKGELGETAPLGARGPRTPAATRGDDLRAESSSGDRDWPTELAD